MSWLQVEVVARYSDTFQLSLWTKGMNENRKNGISTHFQREVNLTLWFVGVVIITGITAAIVAPKIKTFYQKDKCLDSGGAYDKKTHECRKR